MARCIHEIVAPIYNPFSNPFSDGTTINIAELRCVCGCLVSPHYGMKCADLELKVRCLYYKPESVVNHLPDRTEGEHEPPPM